MTVSIIGSGRVGLCLGTLIAQSGQKVLITDKVPDKKEIFKGKLPFYEPQLTDSLFANKDLLKWTRQVDLILSSEMIFFCLSFKPDKKIGDFDLSELLEWVKLIPKSLEEKLLILKSTCPLGTYEKVSEITKGKNLSVVICPEFLREGQALEDLKKPERVVIGSKNISSGKKLEAFYKSFCKAKQFIHSDPETVELSKLACNSFLGTKISFINEWAGLCEKRGGNMTDFQKILGSDSRIGKDFLTPGLGYGGYCLPKDIQLSIIEGQKRKLKMNLLQSVQDVNNELPEIFFKQIQSYYKKLNKVSLAFWGISFKKNTDNIKNSPALKLCSKLLKAGVHLHVYDPLFTKEAVVKIFHKDSENKDLDDLVKKIFEGKVFFYPSAKESLKQKQGLIVAGDSKEFKRVSLDSIKNHLSSAFLVDARCLYFAKDLKKKGFTFYQRGIAR
ncbi:MAG: UDP-glucose/GDP-mannose dehydrogenase family protein [Bdellovibrionales bacterium]|nr:UDP-glucose/GDP-mannose dehydrogenase family protein [Bdellovibrionales bacterium]